MKYCFFEAGNILFSPALTLYMEKESINRKKLRRAVDGDLILQLTRHEISPKKPRKMKKFRFLIRFRNYRKMKELNKVKSGTQRREQLNTDDRQST